MQRAQRKRILVAEDDEDVTLVLRQGLEFLGYEIWAARDGLEAVEMAASQLPDLIIMDIQMPKMDGLQAVSRIRKNPLTQAIPTLVVTGNAMPGDKEKYLACGFDGYIAKPFRHMELRAVIETLLGQSRQ